MKNFVDVLTDFILKNEAGKLDNIMREVSDKIQSDMVAVTYRMIDAYYQDYNPNYYIRTDRLSERKRGKDGKFAKKLKRERKRNTNRYGDVSLQTAVKALNESGQPAIGVSKPLDSGLGYQAGVIFDPDYFNKAMKHSVKGFTEWDIAENFLFGQHGNGSAISSVTEFTEPYADIVLRDYINSYKPRFDKHYRDAYKKYNK